MSGGMDGTSCPECRGLEKCLCGGAPTPPLKAYKPERRAPSHPGEILRREFLEPKRMTQQELARRMGVPVQSVNALVRGRRSLSAKVALKLGRVTDRHAAYWMVCQSSFDLWKAGWRG